MFESEFLRSVLVAGRFATSREDACLTTRARQTKEVVFRSFLTALCSILRQCDDTSSLWCSWQQLTCLSPLSVLVCSWKRADVFVRFPQLNFRRVSGTHGVTFFGSERKLKFKPCVYIWAVSACGWVVVGLFQCLGGSLPPPFAAV